MASLDSSRQTDFAYFREIKGKVRLCQEVMNLSTQAHNLKVVGSNPTPATKNLTIKTDSYIPRRVAACFWGLGAGSTTEATAPKNNSRRKTTPVSATAVRVELPPEIGTLT